MAEKIAGGFLPGSDPEAMQANLAYQQALARMQTALEARQNRMFDPTLLAIAEGMLGPTQTGSFGEAIGRTAKSVRESQAQQEKEERDIAQAQLGLAASGIEMERLKGRERIAREMFGPAVGGALPTSTGGGALPTTTGPLSSPRAPAGFDTSMGVRTMPPNADIENRRNQFIRAAMAKGADPADILKDLAKFDQDRFIKSESGIQDLGSGLFYHTSTKLEPKQVYISENEVRTINVTPGQAAKLDELAMSDDKQAEYYDYLNKIMRAPASARPKIDKTTPEGGERPPTSPAEAANRARMQTVEEQAQDLNYRKERGTLSAKEQSDEAKNWYQRGSDASSLRDNYRILKGIFDPRNKYSQVLTGVFEKGDTKSQIGRLIEEGIVGEALKNSIRDIATKAGLPEQAITQLQVAVGLMSDIKLKASRIMEGQGTVTEAERRLIAESVINVTDTPRTILAKAEYLDARAKFEDDRARMLRDFRDDRRDYNDFVRSAEYKKLKKDYEDSLEKIVERRLGVKLPPRDTGGRDNAGAASRLPESVR
jgi:hypothetical protein